jgi:multiple sugar transport system permease protein
MTQMQIARPAASGSRRSRRSLIQWIRKIIPAIIFLGPAIAAFLLFRYYPLFQGFYMSMFRWDTITPPGTFVGLNNMSLAISSSVFHEVFLNTVILYAFGMLLGFWVPIMQSLFLNELRRGHYIVRFLYVLPVAVPGIAFLIVWKYIWHPEFGMANAVMQLLNLPKQFWLSDPNLVKLTLRLPSVLGGGMGILIYLAAIQNISPEIVEAAIMDGANAWQRTWRIIVPNIRSIIGIMFVLSLTGSLLAFDDVWVMTAGGPGYSSTTLVMGVYQQAFVQNQFGMGSAWALWIFIFTLIFTVARLYTMREDRS